MKYIKLFDNHTEYETYKESEDYIEPCVTHCKTEDDIHYDKVFSVVMTCLINVTNGSTSTLLLNNPDNGVVSKIKINGIEESEITDYYDLDAGVYTVEYTIVSRDLGVETFTGVKIQENLIIPNGITKIGSGCFENCTDISSVYIPDSVTVIDDYAFNNCSDINYIEYLSSNLVTLGNSAFNSCSLLNFKTGVVLPETLTIIGDNCFNGCNITEITIPKSVEDIQDEAFKNCSNLVRVNVLKGETYQESLSLPELGEDVFNGCDDELEIHVPNESAKSRYINYSGWVNYANKIVADSAYLYAEDAD